MQTNYYGVYSSPYLYNGEPYVGSPKTLSKNVIVLVALMNNV